MRALHGNGHLDRCFATETRPYNQGARLTAFEMVHGGTLWHLGFLFFFIIIRNSKLTIRKIADDIPGTLICDSMASALMVDFELCYAVL